MLTRVVLAGGVAVLVTGALVAGGRWRDGQVTACGQRGASLAALDLLRRHPDGFRAEDPYQGCDTGRIIAYAGRGFIAGVQDFDETAVRAFYRDLLAGDRWEIFRSTAAAGRDQAALCATKSLSFGTARASLSFPLAGMYVVSVVDAGDSGPDCG